MLATVLLLLLLEVEVVAAVLLSSSLTQIGIRVRGNGSSSARAVFSLRVVSASDLAARAVDDDGCRHGCHWWWWRLPTLRPRATPPLLRRWRLSPSALETPPGPKPSTLAASTTSAASNRRGAAMYVLAAALRKTLGSLEKGLEKGRPA